MTIELKGNWNQDFAYDNHIVESTFLGYDEYNHEKFDNSRSAMGELVYQLKYRNDISNFGTHFRRKNGKFITKEH